MKLSWQYLERIAKELEQQEIEFLKRKWQSAEERDLEAYYNYLLHEDAGDRD